MAKGLPKWAIKEAKSRGAKNIFAYAWSLVKRKGRSRSSPKKRSNPRKRRSVRRIARKKKGKRGRSWLPTIFKFIRLGSLVGTGLFKFSQMTGSTLDKAGRTLTAYGGWDGRKFNAGLLAEMWLPYLGACLATYGIPKLVSLIRRL